MGAYPASSIETGCVLLSCPGFDFRRQVHFDKAVILLYQHDDRSDHGLILNKPTRHKLKDLSDTGPWSPELNDATLYMGGDVGETLRVLHCDELVGGQPIDFCADLFLASNRDDVRKVIEVVRSGASDMASFMWSIKHCGWGPNQLAREVKRGVWLAVHCSTYFLKP